MKEGSYLVMVRSLNTPDGTWQLADAPSMLLSRFMNDLCVYGYRFVCVCIMGIDTSIDYICMYVCACNGCINTHVPIYYI